MLNSLGQYSSIVSPFIFPTSQKPKWHKGFGLNLAFTLLAIILSLGMSVYYRLENKRRDRVEGGPPAEGAAVDVVNQHDLAPGESLVPNFDLRWHFNRLCLGFRYIV
jgi:hypothetical protein